MTGNILQQPAPFVSSNTTLATIFAGANDVDTIIAALGGGAGGADQTAYINSQIDAFGQEFATLISIVRERAPSRASSRSTFPTWRACRDVHAPLQHRRAQQMLSVGINTRAINPNTSNGVLVVDLMCDPRSYQASAYSSDGFTQATLGTHGSPQK